MVCQDCNDLCFLNPSFLYSVSILITSIALCEVCHFNMSSGRYCPRCNSHNILEYQDFFECIDCGLTFSNETFRSDVDDENILGEEELHGYSSGFTEGERERLRRTFDDEDLS